MLATNAIEQIGYRVVVVVFVLNSLNPLKKTHASSATSLLSKRGWNDKGIIHAYFV